MGGEEPRPLGRELVVRVDAGERGRAALPGRPAGGPGGPRRGQQRGPGAPGGVAAAGDEGLRGGERPLRRRDDKSAPNSVATAEATLAILRDNVTLAQLREWCLRS